jgi:hypothetical protein
MQLEYQTVVALGSRDFARVGDFFSRSLRMSQIQTVPIPEVFILWHPHCQLGETLARRIFEWLRPGNGLGPEVFYRSLPAPEAQPNGLPPALPGESRGKAERTLRKKVSNLQLVLAIVDENMVADFAWRHWLVQLAQPSASANRIIWPVALDASAYNMPTAIKQLNYLRPSGLPLPPPGTEKYRGALDEVVRSLLKQVTETMCRVMLPRGTSGSAGVTSALLFESLPKVTIFLSHAKQDGTLPARRLRDYIYGQTQLAAFYDENDIAFGSGFARVIQGSLGSSDTAALIAVRSARYAGRPWCRRELSLFRRPRQDRVVGGVEHWRLHPSLVVEAMEGRERSSGIPELGNSPMIRWNDEDPNLEELIVTTVIRDAMLAAFHSALGASIPGGDQIVINWLPDPTTLLHIPAIQSIQPGKSCDVFYPGRGLSGLELDILDEFFPRLTFKSFEEALS